MKITPEDIGLAFMEGTKYKNQAGPADMAIGAVIPSPRFRHPWAQDPLPLPEPDLTLLDLKSFSEIVNERRSRRSYSSDPLSIMELSLLLYATQGVQEESDHYHLRTVPSAGARHALETYLCVNRIETLEPGLYHYLPFTHSLERLETEKNTAKALRSACLDQKLITDSAVSFVWTTVFYRCEWKYQQRGIRYIHLDAGHAGQNLYLACEAMDLGCCGIAAFDDDACNELLGIDGKKQFCLYMASVGKRG